jgi:hypothetical protein
MPDPPTIYYPHIPAHVVAATMRALAKRPEDRFATVDEFLHALDGTAPGVITSQPPMYSTPIPAPAPAPAMATQVAPQFAPQFTPPPAPKPGLNKWVLIGGGSAAAVLAIAGGLMYSSSVSHQHELEQQRIIAQRQEAENRRQAAIRQEREEQTKAEEQRTAQELTDRVKREQQAAEAQVQADARARTQAAAKVAAQRAAQRAAQQSTPQAGPAVNASAYQKLNGMWRGTYICAQGQTAAQLLINATPQGVTAAMAFAVPNGKPGTFLMNGNFFPGNGQLNLQFVRWGNRPPNYTPANLTGTVDLNQGVISGRVLAPGCSTFVIRRQ